MTKTVSIKNYEFKLNIIKKKDSTESRRNEKRIKKIEEEILYQTIDKERQEALANIHWLM